MTQHPDDHAAADTPTPEIDEDPNTRPGPRDEGGHGGMATREQEAREFEAQHDD